MLQEKAMLASVSISRWAAHRTDKKVTREVTDQHNAAADSGNFRKSLVDKAHLKALTTSASTIRAYHYKMTLPWNDDGERILPAASFQEFTDTNRQLKAADEKLRRDFVALYPQLLNDAPKRLGTMFDPKDFPKPHEIADKFDIRISFKPIPSAADFRVQVDESAAAEIRKAIEAENHDKFEAAMKDLYTRLHKVVNHISETLHGDDPRIFDTLITNATDLIDCLPALNLTDDPVLNELATDLKAMLPSPTTLRTQPSVRKVTADAADEILAKMRPYM